MVSLRKSGSIGVNAAAVAEYCAEDDGAVMYFNDEEHEIGIEPVSDKEADDPAYTVSKTESGATTASRAFLEDYELIPEVTTQWHDDRELVVIDLNDPTGTYGEPEES